MSALDQFRLAMRKYGALNGASNNQQWDWTALQLALAPSIAKGVLYPDGKPINLPGYVTREAFNPEAFMG